MSRSDELLVIMDEYHLIQHPSPGTPPFHDVSCSSQTLNLAFPTAGLADRGIRCSVTKQLEHDSDHWPIAFVLDLKVEEKSKDIAFA